MVSRVLLVLSVLTLGAAQVEQSIFAQFLYAPALAAKETTQKPSQVRSTTEEATTEESLDVLPLLTRARRSGFSRERYPGGNDLIVNRFKSKMADPGWVPDVFPRFGGDKSSEAAEYESGNWAGVKY